MRTRGHRLAGRVQCVELEHDGVTGGAETARAAVTLLIHLDQLLLRVHVVCEQRRMGGGNESGTHFEDNSNNGNLLNGATGLCPGTTRNGEF